MNRRRFVASVFGAAAAPSILTARAGQQGAARPPAAPRAYWIATLQRLADPVLTNLAAGTLKQRMPVEQAAAARYRQDVTHLEALGRLLAGIAPWLELETPAGEEAVLRDKYRELAARAMASAVDPASPDRLNFTEHRQPLVDAAFLAHALLRAPHGLRDRLDATTRDRLVNALVSTRAITPGFNNWLLFSAMVEAGLKSLGAAWDGMRVDYAVRQHDQWYKGDGVYGDGPAFHWDYYNSFVIHPMLLDVLEECGDASPAWIEMRDRAAARATRYSAVLERLIAPDGSFPLVGRSLAYRCGAFQLLAQAALQQRLAPELSPSQVREALTAVIRRTLDAPDTFDRAGWLRIGVAGHQPTVGESYISTGSLYLCATALLPLGLAAEHRFWSDPPTSWTAKRAWSGEPVPIDKALST